MTTHESLILVDEADNPIGLEDKLIAHQKGLLHRAFSVIVFNPKGEILLQQRAMHKYHSRGLWTNACCSHQRDGEATLDAAHRRLVEEMRFDCPLRPVTVLHYTTPPLDTGLIENEMLHMVAGITDQTTFSPDPDEAMGWRWISLDALQREVATAPQSFSFWFQLYLQRYDMREILSSLRA